MRPDVTLLAFDTSAAHCAAALLLDGTIHTHVEDMARGQGERLMVMLEEVLAAHGQTWADLDAIAVGVGPGNFTGIRISVSAARGLALGLGKPAIGVSLFDTTQHLTQQARVAVPAPRDQIYVLDFDSDQPPAMTDDAPGYALSSAHGTVDHIRAMAQIAAARLTEGGDFPRPAPLYVKAPDAAPSRDVPPVILP